MTTEKKSVHVLLDKQDFDNLGVVAESEGTERSPYVRNLIRQHLATQGLIQKAKLILARLRSTE